VGRSALSRDDHVALIAHLDQHGVFDTRNPQAHVAATLGVSRATVYALRKATQGLHWGREGAACRSWTRAPWRPA
jgi:predicted transcriptional regulator YheO